MELTTVNVVYSFGMNEDGQCGTKKDQKEVDKPQIIRFPTKTRIVSLSAGSRHSLALSDGGHVYSWGWGHVGQLGHGDNNMNLSSPTKICRLQNIVQISAGGMHSACVDSEKKCYTWGNNTYGQLGHFSWGQNADQQSLNIPTVVYYSEDGDRQELLVTKISCGGMHTVAIGLRGELYGWGKADSGQVGYAMWYSNFTTSVSTPKLVSEFREQAADISCGSFYTVILTVRGTVYAMGKEDFGCLGIGSEEIMSSGIQSPTILAAFKGSPIRQISAGGWHSCYLSKDGELFVSGKGEYGRLGLGDEAAKLAPTKVNQSSKSSSLTIEQVSAGGSHTMWITSEQKLFTVGRLDGGRCGLGDHVGMSRITTGRDITDAFYHNDSYPLKFLQILAGGAHSLVLAQYQQVPCNNEAEEESFWKEIADHSYPVQSSP
jgi:E3 ubiquitin-protein ligase HERC4